MKGPRFIPTAASENTMETRNSFDLRTTGARATDASRLQPHPDHADSGLYVLWLQIPRPVRTAAGSLGSFVLAPGLYAYIGTAQRRRSARIARHLKPEKPLRWHIDYIRPHANIVAVSLVDGTRDGECRLARLLAQTLDARIAVRRFGASDCRCPGHLLLCPSGTSLDRVERLALGQLVRLA